jgi:hypothetical protein
MCNKDNSSLPGLMGKSYKERLKIMKLSILSYRHLRRDIEMYKYFYGLYKVPEGLLEFETRTNTRVHGYKLIETALQFLHATTFLLTLNHQHVE